MTLKQIIFFVKKELLWFSVALFCSGIIVSTLWSTFSLSYYNMIYTYIQNLSETVFNQGFLNKQTGYSIVHNILQSNILSCIFMFFLSILLFQTIHYIGSFFLAASLPKINHKLKKLAFEYVLNLDASYFNDKNSGDIEKNITNLADAFCQMLDFSFLFIAKITTLIITFVFCFRFKPMLLFYCGWCLAIATCSIILFGSLMREAAKKTALQNKQSGFVAESLDNIVVYKINQCVNFINKKFTNNQNNEDICHQNVNKLFGLTRFCFGMTNIICFCFSILMIIKIKQLYPGISSGMYFMQFWWAMMAFWDIMWTVMPMFYCIGKLKNSMGFIKESLDIQSKTNEITEFRSLEVKNLTFLNHGQAIFENFNLKCENSFVVIEGASGVGKTTLFNLIFGFRTPDKNTIFINNQDILSINNLHKNISFLPQKDLIYNDSFLKNIILEEDYDDQKLHKILLMLKIDQHLSLDDLDHKQCGTNGNEISGGQAKRIAIARMLLFDNSHKLMLLDEPFNNLSDDIIDNFLGYLKSIKGSRSIVCIDHTGHFRKLADHLVKIGNNDEITLIS